MRKHIRNIPVVLILVSMMIACGGPLKKNESLLDAEAALSHAKSDPEVLRYAAKQLDEAEIILRTAAEAETYDGMNSLAYIGNNQVLTALEITALKQAEVEIDQLSEVSGQLALQTREYETQQARLAAQRAQAEKDRLQQQLAALQAEKTDRGMVMTLGDVLFATGKADLMPGAYSTIIRLAQFMRQYPDKKLKIEGHTDSTGSTSFNLRLSENRANAVRDVLLTEGIAFNRVDTFGYGMSRPVATNDTAEGRQRNRRVEIVIQ